MKILYYNSIITNKKNNFNFYFFDFSFYKSFKFNKNIFIKNINKKRKNFKDNSNLRDKNLIILKKYYNISVYNGKKELFFNRFNNFLKLFFFIFIKKNDFFFKYSNYNNLYKLFNLKIENFDFNYLIKDFINNYNSIFDIKISKVPKKFKKKFKKKFNFELVYIYNKKRLKYTLKLINNYVKNNNKINLENNFFWSFSDILLDPKNSFLWKRKVNIYNKAMKKFFKKNLT